MGNIMELKDKLSKVNDDITITKYDNGYRVNVGGEDHNENWSDANILVTELGDVMGLVTEWALMEQR